MNADSPKDITVVLVYADGSKRSYDDLPKIEQMQIAFSWLSLSWLLSATIMCMLNRKLKPWRNIWHWFCLERFFLGLFLVANIYIFVHLNLEIASQSNIVIGKVKTFNQLPEINPPIYISSDLEKYGEILENMLRIKIGENVQYKGVGFYGELRDEHRAAFEFVGPKTQSFDWFIENISKGFREFDVLQDSFL